jgi:opacity protein-like surface antigen
MIQGDIGGGVDADLTWGAMVAAAYHFNDRFAVEVGYRYMDIDFADSEFVFDGHMEGIQIGLMMKFGKQNEK